MKATLAFNGLSECLLHRSGSSCTFDYYKQRQLPPRKIAPNPKTNLNPDQNLNPNWRGGAIFLGGDCPDTGKNLYYNSD